MDDCFRSLSKKNNETTRWGLEIYTATRGDNQPTLVVTREFSHRVGHLVMNSRVLTHHRETVFLAALRSCRCRLFRGSTFDRPIVTDGRV